MPPTKTAKSASSTPTSSPSASSATPRTPRKRAAGGGKPLVIVESPTKATKIAEEVTRAAH